jgi:hypothetical protein
LSTGFLVTISQQANEVSIFGIAQFLSLVQKKCPALAVRSVAKCSGSDVTAFPGVKADVP